MKCLRVVCVNLGSATIPLRLEPARRRRAVRPASAGSRRSNKICEERGSHWQILAGSSPRPGSDRDPSLGIDIQRYRQMHLYLREAQRSKASFSLNQTCISLSCPFIKFALFRGFDSSRSSLRKSGVLLGDTECSSVAELSNSAILRRG